MEKRAGADAAEGNLPDATSQGRVFLYEFIISFYLI